MTHLAELVFNAPSSPKVPGVQSEGESEIKAKGSHKLGPLEIL